MQYIQKLIDAKNEKNMTNQEVALVSNVPLATVTRVFNGSTSSPTFDTIAPIAIALGVSLDELAGLKLPEEAKLTSPVENALNSYAELLKEKDERISELKEHLKSSDKERHRIMWVFAAFMLLVVLILFIDITNGNFGYFRY